MGEIRCGINKEIVAVLVNIPQKYCDTVQDICINDLPKYIEGECESIPDRNIDKYITLFIKSYFNVYKTEKELCEVIEDTKRRYVDLSESTGLNIPKEYTDCEIIGGSFKVYYTTRLEYIELEMKEYLDTVISKII